MHAVCFFLPSLIPKDHATAWALKRHLRYRSHHDHCRPSSSQATFWPTSGHLSSRLFPLPQSRLEQEKLSSSMQHNHKADFSGTYREFGMMPFVSLCCRPQPLRQNTEARGMAWPTLGVRSMSRADGRRSVGLRVRTRLHRFGFRGPLTVGPQSGFAGQIPTWELE